MREANTYDFSLLILLAVIWGSSFFNIKIASFSYEPITLALVRVLFAIIPLLILCKIKSIKIETQIFLNSFFVEIDKAPPSLCISIASGNLWIH